MLPPGGIAMAGDGTMDRGPGLAVVWTNDGDARRRVLDHARTLGDVRRVRAVRWTPGLVPANCERLNRPELRPPADGREPGPVLVFVLGAPRADVASELRARAG